MPRLAPGGSCAALLSIAIAAVAVPGCARTARNPDIDFSAYQTYAWLGELPEPRDEADAAVEEQPVGEQPVGEEPVGEEPVGEVTVGEDRLAAEPFVVPSEQAGLEFASEPVPMAAVPAGPDPNDDPELMGRIRAVVDKAMARRGLRLVPEHEAQVLVSEALSVEVIMRRHDPDYSTYTVDRAEEATLTVEWLDAGRNELVWSGRSTAILRVLERGMGLYTLRWVPTDQERTWPIERLAQDVVREFPR